MHLVRQLQYFLKNFISCFKGGGMPIPQKSLQKSKFHTTRIHVSLVEIEISVLLESNRKIGLVFEMSSKLRTPCTHLRL